MPPRKRSSSLWIYLIWGMNGAVILCLLIVAVLYKTSLQASAADAPVVTAQSGKTRELPPTTYYLPTLTPNPYYTPPVFETSTPFVLADGPRPATIGLSAGARPIEAYRFG